MDKFLKLPSGEPAKLADLQRKEELKRELGDEPAPLFHEVRELILRKCNPERQKHVRAIFETQPFVKQGGGLVPQFPLQFLLALEIRQLGQFPARKLQELVHAVIDVRAVRRGGRFSPRQ